MRAKPMLGIVLAILPAAVLAQWAPRNEGLPNTSGFVHGINTVAKSDSALFASTNTQVLRSKDEGATWTDVTAGLPAGVRIDRIESNGPTVFVTWHTTPGTANGGMHRSADHGSTWVNTDVTVGANYIGAMHAEGDTIIAYAPTPRLILSTDGGKTWADGPVPPARGQTLLRRGTDLYLGTDIGTHRGTGLGTTWSALPGIGGTWSFAVDGGALYAGTRPAVLRTRDDGQTWDTLKTGMPANVDAWTLHVDGAKMVAGLQRASFSSGAYYSEDSGATWKAWNEGLPGSAKVNKLVARGDMLYAASTGVYRRSLSAPPVAVKPAAREGGTVTLAPGPAGSRTLRLAWKSGAGALEVGVHTLSGREVLRHVLPAGAEGGERLLEVPDAPAGLIFVTVSGEGVAATRRLLLP